MTPKAIRKTLDTAQQRLERPPSQQDLGVAVACLETVAIATIGTPAQASAIWALSAAGRAAACDMSWGKQHLVECALGHLDATRDQLRVVIAKQNMIRTEQ